MCRCRINTSRRWTAERESVLTLLTTTVCFLCGRMKISRHFFMKKKTLNNQSINIAHIFSYLSLYTRKCLVVDLGFNIKIFCCIWKFEIDALSVEIDGFQTENTCVQGNWFIYLNASIWASHSDLDADRRCQIPGSKYKVII